MHFRTQLMVALIGFSLLTAHQSIAQSHSHSQDVQWVFEPAMHGEQFNQRHSGHQKSEPQHSGQHSEGGSSHSSDVEHHDAASQSHSSHTGCQCKHHHGISTGPGHPGKPWCEKPGDVNRGECPPYRYSMLDCKRAGKPHKIAMWAKCGVSKKYSVGFVGGGSGIGRIRGRTTQEGTWGMDYNGFFGLSTVWLDYTRGRHHAGRKQGGIGAYETDGEPAIVTKAHNLKSAISNKLH